MAVYHHVNAFEDDGHVVFDVIAYDDNSLYDMFYLDKLKEQMGKNTMYCKPKCRRFVLPLGDKVCYSVYSCLSNFLVGVCFLSCHANTAISINGNLLYYVVLKATDYRQ